MDNEKLIPYSELCPMLNRNYRTVWKWCKNGVFPQPVKVMGRTVGWKKSDVDKWIADNS